MKKRKAGNAAIACVTSGKGGVGKTFLTVSLASSLARKGKRILVVDCDLGLANTDIMLGVRPERTLKDVVFGQTSLQDVIIGTKGGFDLVPACSGVREMGQLLFEKIQMIKDMLASLEDYDLILLDTGAGMTETVLQFNLLAGRNILVITRELTCLTDAYALIKVMFQVFGRETFHVIVNSATDEKEGEKIFSHLDAICRRFLGFPLVYLGTVVHDDQVPRSIMKQEILVQSRPESKIAASCAAMAGAMSEWTA